MQGLSKNMLGYMIETSRMDPMDVSHLRATCKTLRKNIVDTAEEYRALTINDVLLLACKQGYPQIVSYCITNYTLQTEHTNNGIHVSCFAGHFNCAELCLLANDSTIHTTIYKACSDSNIDVIKWCIEKSLKYGKMTDPRNWLNIALIESCWNGNVDVANYCKSMFKGTPNYTTAREQAVEHSHQHMIEWCDLQINNKRGR